MPTPAWADRRGPRGPRPVADLDTIDRLRAAIDALTARVAALEGRHGARDDSDSHLLAVIAETLEGAPFRAIDLVASPLPAVRAALSDADVSSAAEAAAWLRRMRDAPAAGLRILRGRRTPAGYEWTVQVCTSTCTDGSTLL
jgi:hypothetical protein